jgi:hypothetical protein
VPHHSISQAKDFARLHPKEEEYWSPELCFVSVPLQGQKRDTLHLIDEDLAMRFLPPARILRFRLALATKPNDAFFLCHVPTRNTDNSWNESNLQACEKAKTHWTMVTSRKEEGIEGYKIDSARDPDAFPEPKWPTQSLAALKDTGKHRGVITRTAESVFGALMYLTEKYGRVFPSLEGLAHLAMCCKQSVVTALTDLEQLGFITRIRRIRQIMTPLGFTTRQITNAYRVHEPASGLGLLATLVFATESNSWTPSAHIVESLNGADVLDPESPLHQALARLERAFRSRAAPIGAAKRLSM